MSRVLDVPDGPPAELRFRRRIRLLASLREMWHARELVRTLAERELRVRYKQAVLGFAWAVLTPVLLVTVFTVFVQRWAKVDTGQVWYPLFAYLGLLPWAFFSTAVSSGGQSLLSNTSLLNKIYCPREVFPTASVIVAGVDTLISTGVLLVLFAISFLAHGFLPKAAAVWVPVLAAVQVAFTLGVTLVVSAVMVYLRDLRHALPIALQLGLFATPVAYGIDVVPERLRGLYVALNPLAAVIDGYRRTVLHGQPPAWDLVGPAAATAAVMLVGGYLLFKRMEGGMADVA